MTEQEALETMLHRAGLDFEVSGGSDAEYIELEVLSLEPDISDRPSGYVRFIFKPTGKLFTVYGLSDTYKAWKEA